MIGGISGIGHVAIRVSDIAASLAFYEGKLGFTEMMRLNKDDGSLWLVYLRISDTQFLELFPDAEGTSASGENANGLNHICLEVADIKALVKGLEAQEIPLFRPLAKGADGNWQAWVKDPDGNRIEFMQMEADCLQAQAIARLAATAKAGASTKQ